VRGARVSSAKANELHRRQRKLKEEATRFNHLIDATRREQAMHCVRKTRRIPGEVPWLPGFS